VLEKCTIFLSGAILLADTVDVFFEEMVKFKCCINLITVAMG
jgi:hypothetical protein